MTLTPYALALGLSAPALANVLVNPGFETGTLTPWTGAPAFAVTTIQSSVVHSGSMAAQYTVSPGAGLGSTAVFQSFAPIPQVGTFSFWYRFDALAASTMRLDVALEGGGSSFFTVLPGPADTWVQYVASGPILAGPNRNAVRIYAISASGNSMPAGARIWIDDVDVSPVPAPAVPALAGLTALAATLRRVRRGH